MTDLGIIIAGKAGQGLQLAAKLLGRALVDAGFNVLVTTDTESRIRGGDSFCRLRIADRPVMAEADRSVVLASFGPESVERHTVELEPDAVVLTDDQDNALVRVGYRIRQLPFQRLARDAGAERVMNIVALGAIAATLRLDPELLERQLKREFDGRGSSLIEQNIVGLQAGYQAGLEAGEPVAQLDPKESQTRNRLVTGADALALGAIAGGAGYCVGYPMSPATAVLEACARMANRSGMIVEQAEDEVAAVNQACGASFGGVPAIVVTAGGGLCLMNEGLSLAGMTETGIVVMTGMRPGPATGLATRTAQADLLFTLSCGHGEFARAVLCPADGVGAFRAASRAVRLAEQFQTPVLVLFDQWLADAHWTIPETELTAGFKVGPVEGKKLGHFPYFREDVTHIGWLPGNMGSVPLFPPAGSYRRYEITETGISPRILPGTEGQSVYVDSDEHDEEGHITESAEVRVAMVDKRMRKGGLLANDIRQPERWPDEPADVLLTCFGSTRGVVAEAITRLRQVGHPVAMLHFSELWPFPAETTIELSRHCRHVLTVEGNATAQLAQLMAQECGIRVEDSILRYDGRHFRVANIVEEVKRLLESFQ